METVTNYRLLFCKHYNELICRAKKITDYSSLWVDVLHDTFLSVEYQVAISKCNGWREDGHFLAYMYLRMRTYWYRYIIKEKSKIEYHDYMNYQYTFTDENDFTEDEILKAIEDEPNLRHKEACLMLLSGESSEAIQKRFGVSMVNARTIIFEARKKFFERLYKKPYSMSGKGKYTFRKRFTFDEFKDKMLDGYPSDEHWFNKIKFVVEKKQKIEPIECLNIVRANEGKMIDIRDGYHSGLYHALKKKVIIKENGFLKIPA